MASSTATTPASLDVVLFCDGPNCRKRNVPSMCSRCRRTFYCSPECQRRHWAEHKKTSCEDFKEKLNAHLKPEFRAFPPADAACPQCRVGTLECPIPLTCSHYVCVDCSADFCREGGLPCPECGTVSTESRDLVIALLDSCNDSRLSHAEKVAVVYRAVKMSDRMIHNDGNGLNSVLSTVSYHVTLLQKTVALLLQIEDGALAFDTTQRLMDTFKHMMVVHTEKKLEEEEENREKSRPLSEFLQQLRQTSTSSITYQSVYRYLDDDDKKRFVDVNLLEAQVLEHHREWSKALAVYQSLVGSDGAVEAQKGISRCQVELLQGGVAEEAAQKAMKADHGGKTPGTHRVLAMAQKSAGKLDVARQTMQRALLYEAPWNEDNYRANARFLEDLGEEQRRVEELRRREEAFTEVWGETLELVQAKKSKGLVSWNALRQMQYDMYAEGEEEDEKLREETAKRLQSAASAALKVEEDEVVLIDKDLEDDNMIIDRGGFKTYLERIDALAFDRFKLTKEVRKWWDQGDPKYKEFFVRRLRQLAAGDRSRILQKRLTGSKKTTIYETYLEQKSGFRILWTESMDDNDNRGGIIIWYVSPHDRVSGYMRRIDEAETRTMRQLTVVSAVPDLSDALRAGDGVDGQDLQADQVLLDPFGDIPMKLYMLHHDDLNRMASSTWLPPLYLTTEERRIVETKGTVLLLGRSGTGKTVCICNRIDYDRHVAEGDPTFSQLFVARSQRICAYVSETVGSFGNLDDNGSSLTSFLTFRNLLDDCEARLFGADEESGLLFDPNSRVDYQSFKSYFADVDCELDSLNVWTQIRSFMKGSIEAIMNGASLSLQEYLDFGSRRCRLTKEQRQIAYAAFERYEKYRTSRGLWDDCDRMARLVRKIMNDIPAAREGLARRRVYVDEIQDYTQAEIALFFLICDCGGLFFAGDPAQSVVEGVEFRFEEVRSVAYKLYKDDKRYIPQKPMTVTRNFRSHAGILNIAAEVLDKMFVAFPFSAKELPKDEGLFRGPRPTIFQGMNQTLLIELIAKIQGVVLLTMYDTYVEELNQIVSRGTVVLSIRDSKGLEFPDVIIVDFFKNLPAEQQKPWRLLLQGKDEARQLTGFPELETQLKQLYTAVTRCSKRLFFVETTTSDSGQAFVRFLCNEKDLAIKQDVMEVQETVKSNDEWVATGVQYCTNADSAEDTDRTLFWLDKALYCFQQAKDKDLERKVQVHQESIGLRTDYASLSKDGLDEVKFELEIAQHLKKLAEEGLLMEATRFCKLVMPLLNDFARTALQKRLLPLLPELDDY